MSEVLTDEEIEKLLNPPMKKILPRIKKLSSVSEAIETFKNSDLEKGYEGYDGETYYIKLGIFLKEEDGYYSFLGYPYSSKESVDYEYAFWVYINKELDDITTSDSDIPLYILREIEKEHGINNLEPKEDTVKTVEQARAILEKSFFVKGIKSSKNDALIFYYKIGAYYAEYSSAFAFVGYPYTSLTQIDEKRADLIFVDKWRGKVTPDYHRLSDEELNDSNKYQLSNWQKMGQFDWQEPDSDNDIIYAMDDYSLFSGKDNLLPI